MNSIDIEEWLKEKFNFCLLEVSYKEIGKYILSYKLRYGAPVKNVILEWNEENREKNLKAIEKKIEQTIVEEYKRKVDEKK